jgi:hypothetical protein
MQKLDDAFRSELVELIYGSLLENGRWRQFLDRLNGAMRHGKTTFLFYDSVVRRGCFTLMGADCVSFPPNASSSPITLFRKC